MKKLFKKIIFILPGQGGFTLIELLIAVVIIGVLAAIGLGQFHTAQIRARDAQRKDNLSSVAKALEMYYGDQGRYPDELSWGSSLVDPEEPETIYMKDLPNDPSSGAKYDYETDDIGSYYRLYSVIEHDGDRCFNDGQCPGGRYEGTDCTQGNSEEPYCRYCIASPNKNCQE